MQETAVKRLCAALDPESIPRWGHGSQAPPVA